MRFGLVGDHPAGLGMARALVASGRHQLLAVTGVGRNSLPGTGPAPRALPDLEELLADPAIDAVIVASRPDDRPAHLRRALQSERHVLCVYPPDQNPDIAYEAALIQADTRQALVPLWTESLHPGVARLAELAGAGGPLGTVRLVEMEWREPGPVLEEFPTTRNRVAIPGWNVLWAVGGPAAEVMAFAEHEDLSPDEPLLAAGRFESGGLFQASFLPNERRAFGRLACTGTGGRAELILPAGWSGPGRLTWQDGEGVSHEESWEDWDPWPVLVEAFEQAVRLRPAPAVTAAANGQRDRPGAAREAFTAVRPAIGADGPGVAAGRCPPTWPNAVRLLELDDAARRSVHRRRASTLEYPEATEEVGFKGTMTLVGCGLLWLVLLLVVLSAWAPRLGWLIAPVLVCFLGLQLLRWLIPRPRVPGGPADRLTDE